MASTSHESKPPGIPGRFNQPWGLVHGGVFTAVIETFATTGAYQGRTQQLWQVVITRAQDGKAVARGQVRLQNIDASPQS